MREATTVDKPPPPRGARRVLVLGLPSGPVEVELKPGRTLTIGRSVACEIVVDDASVSRRHVVLTTEPLMIADAGSHNGTTLGGRRLTQGHAEPLAVGESFGFGAITAFVREAAAEVSPPDGPDDVVLEDAAVRAAYAMLDRVGPSDLSVLVRGETGVGKDVFARALHARSGRRGILLEINCASLPESILEAELFGYEKGAFTGAVQAREGLFEAADGGTLFLDEIGELPLTVQAKLLRVLETREIRRLGARTSRRIDVRFVSATHRDLEAMVAAGAFRQDLFFRVCGVAVTLPPLRVRTDLLRIAEHMLAKKGRPLTLSAAATQALVEHAWPGNVRELRNVIDRAAVLAGGGAVEPRDLGLVEDGPAKPFEATVPPPAMSGSLDARLRDVERATILEAITRSGGNKTKAAKLLGISRYALLYRLRAHDK